MFARGMKKVASKLGDDVAIFRVIATAEAFLGVTV